MKAVPALAMAAYLLAAFLTGGYYANHRLGLYELPMTSAYAGAFWPAYWAGRLALEVTR